MVTLGKNGPQVKRVTEPKLGYVKIEFLSGFLEGSFLEVEESRLVGDREEEVETAHIDESNG